MKNKRKQRDTNSSRLQQKSPPFSAPNSPNENWMSATGSQNQASQTSTMQDHTLSSSSNHDFPSQSRPSPKQALSPDQMSNPSPASSFQRQVPHSTQMQNHSMPSIPPPPQSYCQNQGNQNQNWTPVTGSQNQVWHPSQLQKQAPPLWSGPNQSPEPGSRYQSQPAKPPISNNDYLYNNLAPSSFGTNMPSHVQNPDFQGGDMPLHVQQNNHYKDVSRHVRNSVSHDGCPPEPLKHQPYQNNYRDMQSSNSMVYPHGDWNCQKANMTPSAPAWGMPSHVQNPVFQEREASSHQQNGYSDRGFPGDVQKGNSHNGYLSTAPQHQQYQNSYVDLQRSNAMVHAHGALNYQNANMTPSAPRDMPSQTQKSNFHRDDTWYPVQLNGDSHSERYPSHTSPQQYQNNFREAQTSNATGSPQIGNYQKTTAPMQNNSLPNASMSPHVLNQFQGADMPKPRQNIEYQYGMSQATKQVDTCSGEALPDCTGRETVYTRDYQERDVPSDEEYVYASK